MTSETLSQNEIDQLFEGSAKPAPAAATRGPAGDVQLYDFHRPNRISKERMRTLEAMYGLVCKSIEAWLTGRLRSQVDLEVQSVEQFTFGEFVISLTAPCTSFIYEIEDSGGHQAVIDFGSDFAFHLIDRLLGGGGESTPQGRALTPLERLVMRPVADRVTQHLTDAWQDHVPMRMQLSRFESIPDMLQIANREDPVLVASVQVRAGAMKSLLLLCLPFAVVEDFFTSSVSQRVQAARGSARERAADRLGVEGAVTRSQLRLTAQLPSFRIPLGHLASLAPGLVLQTGLPADARIQVLIGDRVRYLAAPGRVARRLALRIVEEVTADAANDRLPVILD